MTNLKARDWAIVAAIAGLAFTMAVDIRVPLLSLVDLGFHELGHLVTYPFPDLVTALAGSVTQVAVPLGLAAYFVRWRNDPAAGGLCGAWSATAAVDSARYIADAPYERLELIGGDHDWAYILGPTQFNMPHNAGTLATIVRVLAWLLIAASVAGPLWPAIAPELRPGRRTSL